MGARGVVGVKSDWEWDDEGSCGGSSFKSIDMCVGLLVSGLCAAGYVLQVLVLSPSQSLLGMRLLKIENVQR